MKIIKDIQHRPFSCFTLVAMTGEGIRGLKKFLKTNDHLYLKNQKACLKK